MARFGGLNRLVSGLLVAIISLMCSGCIPSFIPLSDPKSVPAGPKVSDLIDNLKCELAEAQFSPQKISYGPSGQYFVLGDQLSRIHYVATVTFTLEVTNQQNFQPSFSFLNNFSTPMTNLTLAVGGQYNESEDRNITLNMVVDLGDRTIIHGLPKQPCGRGTELQGDLVLREIIAMGLIAVAENSAGAEQSNLAFMAKTLGAPSGSGQPNPPQYPTADTTKSLGSFGTVTIFTITEGVSGGPNWTLTHFKGPAANGSWLGLTRIVKDQINISFAPYCHDTKFDSPTTFPPVWQDGLPQTCNKKSPDVARGLSQGIGAGLSNNTMQLLQSIQPLLNQ